jgi:hypothetical protein
VRGGVETVGGVEEAEDAGNDGEELEEPEDQGPDGGAFAAWRRGGGSRRRGIRWLRGKSVSVREKKEREEENALLLLLLTSPKRSVPSAPSARSSFFDATTAPLPSSSSSRSPSLLSG